MGSKSEVTHSDYKEAGERLYDTYEKDAEKRLARKALESLKSNPISNEEAIAYGCSFGIIK